MDPTTQSLVNEMIEKLKKEFPGITIKTEDYYWDNTIYICIKEEEIYNSDKFSEICFHLHVEYTNKIDREFGFVLDRD